MLDPPETARTVRVRDGGAAVTDGPFAELKEQIAGFDVAGVRRPGRGVRRRPRPPVARLGLLELRPFWPFGTD